MSYVIIKSQIPQLLSTVHFIQLFTTIDISDEIPFMNFKSAIEIIKDLLINTSSYAQWTMGLLKPVTLRMKKFNQQKK